MRMSWYPDMGCNTMVAEGDHVRAVGWLSAQRPFPTGEVSPEFLARLRELYRLSNSSCDTLRLRVFGGVHSGVILLAAIEPVGWSTLANDLPWPTADRNRAAEMAAVRASFRHRASSSACRH